MKLIDKFIDKDITDLKFTNQELSVYHYITEQIDNIGKITAKEIAEHCFCTTTTVNRFCKKYGVNGFSEFSAIISYEISQEETYIEKIEEVDNDILKYIDINKPLFIFGSGASLFSASVISRYLLRRGYLCILLEDRYFLKHVMREQVLLLSNSGVTAPALDLAYTANQKGMLTLAVPARNSELAKICDHSLVFKNNIQKISSNDHESQMKMFTALNGIMN